MITGYRAALADGADVVVKIDGDGQMDPALIPRFIRPIMNGDADYTKGNRFYDLAFLRAMPRTRLFANAVLSFVNKIASGYWDIMDPTNGYSAIHRTALAALPLENSIAGISSSLTCYFASIRSARSFATCQCPRVIKGRPATFASVTLRRRFRSSICELRSSASFTRTFCAILTPARSSFSSACSLPAAERFMAWRVGSIRRSSVCRPRPVRSC